MKLWICRPMDEVGEYQAKWDKPIPRKLRMYDISEKLMMIYNRGCEGGKNGGKVDWIDKKEGREGWEEEKVTEWDKYHYPMYMYDYTIGMTLLHSQPEKQVGPHLFMMNQNKYFF